MDGVKVKKYRIVCVQCKKSFVGVERSLNVKRPHDDSGISKIFIFKDLEENEVLPAKIDGDKSYFDCPYCRTEN